ncbi:helix-turn-helix domain-containing protein, partial [Pseudoxanthomonas taiwanensis]|uniref:helix-turn-helix domain-containing protein n=1 Tax=Pseudoxanthomonas taiwanensis TaxID=176598 RepID=UPI001FEAC64F
MAFDLNDTLIFVKVVEQGSFTAAARALGLPKTTVSRKVQELEARLGAQLLNRTTRRLRFTWTSVWDSVRLPTATKARLLELFVLGVPSYRQRFLSDTS